MSPWAVVLIYAGMAGCILLGIGIGHFWHACPGEGGSIAGDRATQHGRHAQSWPRHDASTKELAALYIDYEKPFIEWQERTTA